MILDVSIYTGYIERRDIPKVQDIVSDMLTMYRYRELTEISSKISDALYHAFFRLYNVDIVHHDRMVTNEDYDYEIKIMEVEREEVNFNTYGKYY